MIAYKALSNLVYIKTHIDTHICRETFGLCQRLTAFLLIFYYNPFDIRLLKS